MTTGKIMMLSILLVVGVCWYLYERKVGGLWKEVGDRPTFINVILTASVGASFIGSLVWIGNIVVDNWE